MSEIIPSQELDFNEWLATGGRTTHYVGLYARMNLLADIEALEVQKVAVPDVPAGDESMGGEEDPNADLQTQIDELYRQIHASKKTFRVTALNEEEIEKIRQDFRKSSADKISEVAAEGRAEARRTAKRMEVTDPPELNTVVRAGAKKYTDDYISREVGLLIVANAAKMQTPNGELVNLSYDQVRSIYEMLGESQLDRLVDASMQANSDVPEVTPSKS